MKLNNKNIYLSILSSSLVSMAFAGSPFQGYPTSIPGSVEAEHYDFDGAYDLSAGNQGGQFRNDNVDIERRSGGGFNVGWFEPEEWLEYTIDVQNAGNYQLTAQVASNGGGGQMQLLFRGNTYDQSDVITVTHTNGWQNWQNTTPTTIYLNAGEHVVQVKQLSGAFNFDSFKLAQSTQGNDLEAYPGYSGEYNGYTLVHDERFDDFNNDVWARGDGAVGGESMCRFTANGVQVNNGILDLKVAREYVAPSWSENHQSWKGAYDYSCGELRTVPQKRIRFGRIETRMKAPARANASGYISSLFTYRHEGQPREWEEIDIELEGGRPDKFQANLIYGLNAQDWNSTRQWGAWEDKITVGPVDSWRVFAIEWTPEALRWFIDGELVKTLSQTDIDCNPNCQWPQVFATPIPDDLTEIMMNFWIPNDSIQNDFGGNKYRNQYPMTTQYDWIRIYELDSHPLSNW